MAIGDSYEIARLCLASSAPPPGTGGAADWRTLIPSLATKVGVPVPSMRPSLLSIGRIPAVTGRIASASARCRRLATTGTPTPSDVSAATAHSSPSTMPVAPEVEALVERICRLDLFQTAQLVGLLKKALNLPDVLPMMGAAPPAAATTAASPAAAAAPPQAEKSEFRVTLDKFDPASKAKIIREVKSLLPQLNLVEAKNFVEGAPKLIKDKVKKEEAEKIKKTLEDLGATVTLD